MAAEELQLLRIISTDFLSARKLKLMGELPSDDIISYRVTVSPGYVRVGAAAEAAGGEAARRVDVCFMGGGSKYMQHGNDFDSLLSDLTKDKTLDELILVAPDTFFAKSNLLEIFQRHADSSKTFCNPQPYQRFSMNVLASSAVSPHRIMPESEVAATFTHGEKRVDLPAILVTDPIVLWIGARVGQVIEVTRPSPSTGRAITYYRVK